jgi:hypothetical protein
VTESWKCPRCQRPYGETPAHELETGDGKELELRCPNCLESATFSLDGELRERSRIHRRCLYIHSQFPIAGGEIVVLHSALEELVYDPSFEEELSEIGFREGERIIRYRSLAEFHAQMGEHFTREWFRDRHHTFAKLVVDFLRLGNLTVSRAEFDHLEFYAGDVRYLMQYDGFVIASAPRTP